METPAAEADTADTASPASSDGAPAPGISGAGELIAAIQRRLNESGFDAGPADGLAGPRTREALRSYQRRMNLPVTGRFDEAVTRHLFASLPPRDDRDTKAAAATMGSGDDGTKAGAPSFSPAGGGRSEERRVGKGGVRPCTSRGWQNN